VDHQQLAKYCHQLPSKLCCQHVHQLLTRTDAMTPTLLTQTILGKLGYLRKKKKHNTFAMAVDFG
jgi:hypothetical protein